MPHPLGELGHLYPSVDAGRPERVTHREDRDVRKGLSVIEPETGVEDLVDALVARLGLHAAAVPPLHDRPALPL